MCTFSKLTKLQKKDGKIITTEKLRGHRRRERAAQRGMRAIRTVREWFGMCWGLGKEPPEEEEDERRYERESLLVSKGEKDGLVEHIEEYDGEETEDEEEDERLMGAGSEVYVPKHAAVSFLRSVSGNRRYERFGEDHA